MTAGSTDRRAPGDGRENESFLDELEKFAGRKFSYRPDIAMLLGCSRGREGAFDEITFYAKFISRAVALLKRPGGEDVTRLEAEFGEKLGKTSSLIRTLLERAPDDAAQKFIDCFLTPSHESMDRYLGLLYEMSWIKNYDIEKKRSG